MRKSIKQKIKSLLTEIIKELKECGNAAAWVINH